MKKKHLRVLKQIQESVPKEWLDKVVTRGPIAPTIRKVFEEAVKNKDLPEEKRKMAQYMLDSGQFDKEVDQVNEEVTEKIEQYISDEIDKAIQLGRLPEKDKGIEKKLKKLIKKYGRETSNKRGDEDKGKSKPS